MEDSDTIKYLASTIAHKEKVILGLIRQLDEAKVEADRLREYWLEDSAELKRLKNAYEGKTNIKPCCKGSADDILNGNA